MSGRHPAEFAGEPVDLLLHRPGTRTAGAGGRSGGVRRAPAPRRGGALWPGGCAGRSAVSYGTSPRGYPHLLQPGGGDKIVPGPPAGDRHPGRPRGGSARSSWCPFRRGRTPWPFWPPSGVLLLLGAEAGGKLSFRSGHFGDKIVSAGQGPKRFCPCGHIQASARGQSEAACFYAPQSTGTAETQVRRMPNYFNPCSSSASRVLAALPEPLRARIQPQPGGL